MNTKSKTFKFGLNDDVLILCNKDEIGKVVARAEYTSSDPRYLIRYKTGGGWASESWWDEEALTLCEA